MSSPQDHLQSLRQLNELAAFKGKESLVATGETLLTVVSGDAKA